jgi:hypothetical protein
VNFGEFLALTLSGLVVNIAGIALTSWFSHRRLREHLDRRTSQQTTDIEHLTAEQTVTIEHLTEAQTAELLGHPEDPPAA